MHLPQVENFLLSKKVHADNNLRFGGVSKTDHYKDHCLNAFLLPNDLLMLGLALLSSTSNSEIDNEFNALNKYFSCG